jgi:hypothetical protein
MTGLAFQGTAGQPGRVTNVFYHRVEDLAKLKTCSKGEILGHAAAHELSHLLLGNLDHASTGLMKARFGPRESCQRRPRVHESGSGSNYPGSGLGLGAALYQCDDIPDARVELPRGRGVGGRAQD